METDDIFQKDILKYIIFNLHIKLSTSINRKKKVKSANMHDMQIINSFFLIGKISYCVFKNLKKNFFK